MKIVDTAIALRIIYLLVTPIESTMAFKLGLIDADGKTIKKAKTPEEKDATSMLHRLVWNLKRLISLVPGGSTKIGSLTAAYLLMREAIENDWSEAQLHEQTVLNFYSLCENKDFDDIVNGLLDTLIELEEDAPANAAGVMPDLGGVAKSEKPLGPLFRRKKLKVIQLPE